MRGSFNIGLSPAARALDVLLTLLNGNEPPRIWLGHADARQVSDLPKLAVERISGL